MEDYEKLGAFYLGRPGDSAGGKSEDGLVLYDSKDLVTHAVCFGMTGSGKTGLCIAMMEEAAIDGVPVIAVDPKGDISNLLLTFPELSAERFFPGSMLTTRGAREFRRRSTPAKRRNAGRAGWLRGDRTRPVSGDCGKRRISRCILPGARRVCRSPS